MPKASWWLFFAATIFLSAFLLFSVEPLVARRILPWFGGSAAVWSTCLVFYQTALLAGYAYAFLTTRYLRPRAQTLLHILLLVASLALLPIGPSARWKLGPLTDPTVSILEMLTAAIGLPFVALSATSPLLQAWLVRRDFPNPYRLFAVSNFASLAALLAYPLLIEPALTTRGQSLWWSGLYALFVTLCALAAWCSRKPDLSTFAERDETSARITALQRLKWFSLAACGSMLLLSVTNQIDENVAAVPLLWVLPLAIYLLTFVLGFGTHKIYNRPLWLRLLAFALGLLGYAIYNIDAIEAIQISLPVFLGGLFVCCLFCHGELNRSRPDASGLANFYLLIAAGGAVGAIFVGLIAPRIFSGIYELPLTLIITAALALLLIWSERVWGARVLWIAVTGCMITVMVMNVGAYRANSLTLRRSFYGSLRVVQTRHAGPEQQRMLFHGTIEHGAQFLLPPGRFRPTTYYGPDSGVGILLRECFDSPKRVGVVGLGVGTVAVYGHAGDFFQFYEINSQVVEIAQSLFFYLHESHAQSRIIIGDGRLSLERERSPLFDVLVLDAFSGDAIPVHLLTREAVALYLRHLKPNGALAFHVSNNYLDLAPVVLQLAELAGYRSVLVHNHSDEDAATLPADWVLVTNNDRVLHNSAITLHSRPIQPRTGLRPWTDDYNNLLQAFKTPQLH